MMTSMGLWKALVGKILEKTDEARGKAVQKATDMAIDRGKRAAKAAVGGTARKIEEAIFGDVLDEAAEKKKLAAEPKPDPFAKLKAAEAKKKEEDFAAKAKARAERDVENELTAMKKKLGK